VVRPFEAATLTWPWRHVDPRVDRLQEDVMRLVGVTFRHSRHATFDGVMDLARAAAGRSGRRTHAARDRATVPYLNEPWYC
jgi:hypothetical protein